MNNQVNTIAQALVKKTVDECSLTELRQFTQQYPYFGPLHLLLAAKLKSTKDESRINQYQKTSLYFNNTLWLDYLLTGPATVVRSLGHTVEEEASHDGQKFEEAEVIESEAVTEVEMETPIPSELQPEAVEFSDVNEKAEIVSAKEENKEIDDDHQKEEENQPGLKIPELKIAPLDPAVPFTFEPYHTVDYFASQGIRMREENRPTDRFSQQLKSFTEWLKTMKKIPAVDTGKPADTIGEQKVEQMAATSLTDREVVTEAMAEVWEKQGEHAKAREIYRKLSLLDPSKSAYFAAKIEGLK